MFNLKFPSYTPHVYLAQSQLWTQRTWLQDEEADKFWATISPEED